MWSVMRRSSRFHSLLVFLGFVVIAAVFWLVLALNDSLQSSYIVKLQIVNAPDSVTFITDMPEEMHVSVRDRGSALLRSAVMKHPTVSFNFRDYASDGHFKIKKTDLQAQLKGAFGASATILSASLDSINLVYTTNKGRRVPVVPVADCTAAAGMVLKGKPVAVPNYVVVYGSRSVLDTLNRVFTERIVKRDLSENKSYDVSVTKIKGVRIEPAKVKINVDVEPLVNKTEVLPIKVIGVPEGESLLLFPAQVTVDYFVPMSRFSAEKGSGMKAEVSYKDAVESKTGKVNVRLVVANRHVINAHLTTDSVEYTIVR